MAKAGQAPAKKRDVFNVSSFLFEVNAPIQLCLAFSVCPWPHIWDEGLRQYGRTTLTLASNARDLNEAARHHRWSFKLSNNPFFIEKLLDVVGLDLNAPDNALVATADPVVLFAGIRSAQGNLGRRLDRCGIGGGAFEPVERASGPLDVVAANVGGEQKSKEQLTDSFRSATAADWTGEERRLTGLR